MPRISYFLGITIAMYYNEHYPPHFHIEYAGHEATMLIGTLDILSGILPRRIRALVLEWASLHRAELYANWEKARQGLPLDTVEPLD
jgi:hypothetical protein